MAELLPLTCCILLLLLACLPNPVRSQNDEFFYNSFADSNTSLSLNGVAKVETNGTIRLTNDTRRLLGHAFYTKPIRFKKSAQSKAFSFSTAFTFAIVPEFRNLGGHGMAFVIAISKELTGAFPSQYLGLLNASNNGNTTNHIFAVEFDTVQDFEFGDINDNHVGIDINSMTSETSMTASYILGGEILNLKSGKTIEAWIDYDGVSNLVNVSLSPFSEKPTSPLLSYKVDLSPILQETMFVGFSASTGLLASSHYVFGWSFKMNGAARSLQFPSLPSLPGPKRSHRDLILEVSISTILFIIFSLASTIYLIRKIKNADFIKAWEFNVGPHRFSYKELKKATKNFLDKELLGSGGFGKVYKGVLPKSKVHVAVKRIAHGSRQGLREFAAEIGIMGRLRHRNLVQLLGWGRRRGDLLLVYNYMPNGSLDKYIYENEAAQVLSWEERFKIIKNVASGLLYLHEGWEQTVIHRDVKAANVLLDSEMNGRLGDFGLAKLCEHGVNPSTTRVVGTLGYLAPELTKTGKPTTGSDVFAFGALLLEVVCGRRPIERKRSGDEMILVDWVWGKWEEGAVLDVMDKRLRGQFDETEAIVVLKLGLMCSNDVGVGRPTMRQVVRYLEGEAALPDSLASPAVLHSYSDSVTYDKMSLADYSSFSLSGSVAGGGRKRTALVRSRLCNAELKYELAEVTVEVEDVDKAEEAEILMVNETKLVVAILASILEDVTSPGSSVTNVRSSDTTSPNAEQMSEWSKL
ncbi:unnamed protein product [Rhodiola kirilowii]